MSRQFAQLNSLDLCNQVVIYGANGWMGRSAFEFISSQNPSNLNSRVLLIGSRSSKLILDKVEQEVFAPTQGFAAIREGAIFFNAAFHRREFLQSMSLSEYVRQNHEIASLAKRAIETKNLKSFVNLSSGAARELDSDSTKKNSDAYTVMKKSFEMDYEALCNHYGTTLVNCRIFSISGKHINEFKNLALSNFIHQSQTKRRILVNSPSTLRTFVDSVDLAGVLLTLGCQDVSLKFDSGGQLIDMLNLAKRINHVVNNSEANTILGHDRNPDYFGRYLEFNSIMTELGFPLKGIDDQIKNTLRAFTK